MNLIVPLYIEQGILVPNGCNVGCKVKHVMVTMALLNGLNGLQKPNNFKNALAPLISYLCILKERGFYQSGDSY